MSAQAPPASYSQTQNAITSPSDPYSATEPSYRRSSTGRQPAYEPPVIPDYDPDAQDPDLPEYRPRANRNGQPSMRRYDERYTSGSLPPLQTGNMSKARAPGPGQYIESGGRRYASDPVSATSPLSPKAGGTRKGSAGADLGRNSLHGRSPLQRLEVTLDEKSKEEKRAKVLEAEMVAQERLDKARRASQRASDAIGDEQNPTATRPPETSTVDTSAVKRSRAVGESSTAPNGYNYAPGLGPPSRMRPRATNDSTVTSPSQPSAQTSVPFRYDGGYRSFSEPAEPYQNNVSRPAPRQRRDPRLAGDAALAGGAAASAGAAIGPPQHLSEWKPPGNRVGRSGSRKLHKEPPAERRISAPWHHENSPTGQQQLHRDRMDLDAMEQGAPPVPPKDAQSRQDARIPTNYGPTYSVPPQTTTGLQARKAVGFNQQPPAMIPPSNETERSHRFSNIIHPGHQEEARRYQPGPQLDQWDKVRTVRLIEDDLDLSIGPIMEDAQERSTAWWEKSEGQRRRSSFGAVQAPTVTYDGHFDAETGQTCFNPLLYLKSGPLLRFRGIYKERRAGHSGMKEVWRGSLMIVTIDSRSDYSRGPPMLRLFKQPVDLLPPPPAQIDATSGQQLAPEYVDPIAGQVKMSRIGKTLYVKPVELLEEHRDLSRIENDNGLFEERPSGSTSGNTYANQAPGARPNVTGALPVAQDGEKLGKVRELAGVRLHTERGVTFWKWNIEIALNAQQQRIAYRINRGPAIGFWVPAQNESMNMMFHSCNGFSLSVHPDDFSGPDPLWRDVLNSHQTRPFHVMIGGGDQVYMDLCTVQTQYFREWTEHKNPHYKNNAPFIPEMQDELEEFYLNRYAMWFSQGLFGMATSQIPMVNIWDDHDIIDGYGSYPHHTMVSPVFTGIGAVAFKYYMLFQHQSVPMETEEYEPSWLLGAEPGPYISQLSRSVFLSMGNGVHFLGLDCRTERMRDEILSEESWERVFNRCEAELHKGDAQHLIVLLGVPIAYPRLNFLENVLTSRAMDPIKAIGRSGVLGGFVNKFDGGVEILDDLDDHWTAKHHKRERNWFIQQLQVLAAQKSVRITILGGDVHLAAVGRFFSDKKLGIPKDRDHRYMPNIISSAIVNTPPGDMLADILNRRNKVHHLDDDTDEDMIAMFPHDVDGKPRHNTHLLPRRNWCSIRHYHPGTTPPPTPPTPEEDNEPEPQSAATMPDDASYESEERPQSGLQRTLSFGRRSLERPRAVLRRLSGGAQNTPPISYYNATGGRPQQRRASSDDAILNRPTETSNSYFPSSEQNGDRGAASDSSLTRLQRPSLYHRRPSGLTPKEERKLAEDERGGHIDLRNGLDIRLNVENVRGDPAGTTTEYRLLVPALEYRGGPLDANTARRKGRVRSFFESLTERGQRFSPANSPMQSPDSTAAGAEGNESESYLNLGPGERTNVAAALNGQNQRLQKLQAQDTTAPVGRASKEGVLGGPPGAQARANAVNALPNSPVLAQTPVRRDEEDEDENLYPAVQNPRPMRGASNRHSSAPVAPKTRTDDFAYAPAARMAEPGATVGAAAAQAQIGDDGRPVRRRWRGDSYDEDAVMPSSAAGAGASAGSGGARNQSRWSDEYDENEDGEEEGPVGPPSQQRWSSPAREQEGKRVGVFGRMRNRMSGWRAWRM